MTSEEIILYYFPEIGELISYFREVCPKIKCKISEIEKNRFAFRTKPLPQITTKYDEDIRKVISNMKFTLKLDFSHGDQSLSIVPKGIYCENQKERFYGIKNCKVRDGRYAPNLHVSDYEDSKYDDAKFPYIERFSVLKGLENKAYYSAEEILNFKDVIRKNFFTKETMEAYKETEEFFAHRKMLIEKRAIALDNFSNLENLLTEMLKRIYKKNRDRLDIKKRDRFNEMDVANIKYTFEDYEDSTDRQLVPGLGLFESNVFKNNIPVAYLYLKVNPDTLEAKLALNRYEIKNPSLCNRFNCTNWCSDENELVHQMENVLEVEFSLKKRPSNFHKDEKEKEKDENYRKMMTPYGIY